ncbi:hypothetical protein ACN3XK_12925 [Actinomadura welshii]
MLSLTAVQAVAFPLNDDTVTPGFLGFGVFIALAVATYLLIRSMSKQMKKIQAPREADLIQQEWERAEGAKAAKPGTGTADGPASTDDS